MEAFRLIMDVVRPLTTEIHLSQTQSLNRSTSSLLVLNTLWLPVPALLSPYRGKTQGPSWAPECHNQIDRLGVEDLGGVLFEDRSFPESVYIKGNKIDEFDGT